MKATGMIRKIDDLGRVVIPKEIRKTLRMREGDALEIYVEKTGEIILKRYAPLGDMLEELDYFAEAIYKNTGHFVCITDNKNIISTSEKLGKKYVNKNITDKILNKLEERMLFINNNNESNFRLLENEDSYIINAVAPIISDGNIVGSIILCFDKSKKVSEADIKIIQTAVDFLSSKLS